MRKNILILVAIILLSIITSSAFAQSPQISTGLTWLNSAQTTTGNWPGVETNEYYSTAAALDAVYALEPTSPVYTAGLQWMNVQMESPTDYLSRRIIALKRAGMNVSSELEGLLLYRNSAGSWGATVGFDGNILDIIDTTLALTALNTAGYSDYPVLFQAVNFLTTNQNADGGWGVASGTTSNVYVTATVLKTLALYNNITFNVQSSVSKAAAYLLSKQNPDNGFGSSPSNVYETALALDALIASGANNITTVVSNGVGYLTTTQLSDGSWNDDPYYTALALQALAKVKPNLSITTSDITFSKPMPLAGETITITANIKNIGLENASTIIVRFYQGDPSTGGTQIGTDQVIQLIALGSSSTASVTTVFTGTGSKTIFVVVDPDNLISETSKADNRAMARLWVATGADLAVFSEDLKPSTYTPVSGTAFTLQYTVRNLGESATGAFDVAIYDGQPSGTPLQTAHISGIDGTGMRMGTIGVTLTGDGPHTLYIVADSGNAITELSKTNNTA